MIRIFVTFLLLAFTTTATAFVVRPQAVRAAAVQFEAHNNRFLDLTAIVAITASSPFAALAEEADGYEYGAVDAPIGTCYKIYTPKYSFLQRQHLQLFAIQFFQALRW